MLTAEGALPTVVTDLGVLVEAVVNTAVIRTVDVYQLPNGSFIGILIHTTA